jgi:uncharacterized membrane protein YdjX (TVP38/TMEM64 family)
MAGLRLTQKLGPVGLFGLLWVIIPTLCGFYLVSQLGPIAEYLGRNRAVSAPVWTMLMALCIGVGLLPAYSNTFLCGWVFGWIPGCVSAITSYLGAATLGYYLAHRLSYQRVNSLIQDHESVRRVRHALLYQHPRRAVVIAALFRLAGPPFPLTNLLMASCGVPLRVYLLGTLLGLGPRVVVGTLVAASAARTGARDIQMLARNSQHPILLVVGAIGFLLGLGLLAHFSRSALRQATEGS